MPSNEILEKIKSAHTCVDDAVTLVCLVWSKLFQKGLSIGNMIEIAEINRKWLTKHKAEPGCISEEDLGIFTENQEKFKNELLRNEVKLLKYSEALVPASDNEEWQLVVRLAEYMKDISAMPNKWKMILEG